jgi:hypothetical protein
MTVAIRPHTRTDNELYKLIPTIGCTGFTIHSYLNMRENRRTGRCNPSLTRISLDLGIDKKTVIKYLDILEEHNLISREARYTTRGRRTSNQYHLLKTWGEVDALTSPEPPTGSGEIPPWLRGENFHPTPPPLDCRIFPPQQVQQTNQTSERTKTQEQCQHPTHAILNPAGHFRFCGHCYLPLNDEEDTADEACME